MAKINRNSATYQKARLKPPSIGQDVRPVNADAKAKPVSVVKGGWVIGAFFAVAAFSQIKLQIFESASTTELAEKTNRYTVTKVDGSKRGAIFSADGKPLAEDIENYELSLRFDKVPHAPAFALALSQATGIPASEFEGIAEGSRTWTQPISARQADAIRTVKREWRADGISLSRVGIRNYPLGEVAASFIGTSTKVPVKDEKTGEMKEVKRWTGLESTRDLDMRGMDGRRVGLTDRSGALLPFRSEQDAVQRQDGKDLTLTVDSELQVAASTAVKATVLANKAVSGVAVVIDPKNGDVLALANYPSFDPKAPLPQSAGYNPAYQGVFEPGSTFKVLTLAKAIDAGKVPAGWTMNCTGEVHLNKYWKVKCDLHHGSRAHGLVDEEKAIAKSCNVAAASWALQVGREDFMKYMEDLGLFAKSNLGLPREVAGKYNKNEYAKKLQLAQFGFGQSMGISPVLLAGAFSTLANNGVHVEPRLVKKIGNQDVPPVPGVQVLKPETCTRVLQSMEAVVESNAGTGKTLRIPGYRLGGKTGTAQKIGVKKGGYVSNFVGTVPAYNPKAIVLVMVDDPKGGKYYGADVAGPAFVSIARSVIRRFGIQPSDKSFADHRSVAPAASAPAAAPVVPSGIAPSGSVPSGIAPSGKAEVPAVGSGDFRAVEPVESAKTASSNVPKVAAPVAAAVSGGAFASIRESLRKVNAMITDEKNGVRHAKVKPGSKGPELSVTPIVAPVVKPAEPVAETTNPQSIGKIAAQAFAGPVEEVDKPVRKKAVVQKPKLVVESEAADEAPVRPKRTKLRAIKKVDLAETESEEEADGPVKKAVKKAKKRALKPALVKPRIEEDEDVAPVKKTLRKANKRVLKPVKTKLVTPDEEADVTPVKKTLKKGKTQAKPAKTALIKKANVKQSKVKKLAKAKKLAAIDDEAPEPKVAKSKPKLAKKAKLKTVAKLKAKKPIKRTRIQASSED